MEDIYSKTWFLDFNEKDQMWHQDLRRIAENEDWTNIAHGKLVAIDLFCEAVDEIGREFGIRFTTNQVIRLAEIMPGLIVYCTSEISDDKLSKEHEASILSKKIFEEHIEWK